MSLEFGIKLRSIRKNQKITQLELAKVLETTEATISRWEKGTQEPSITLLKKLASYLGVSVDELIDYDAYDYNFEHQHDNKRR